MWWWWSGGVVSKKRPRYIIKEDVVVNKFVVVLYESIPLNIYQDILHHFKTKSRQDTNTFIIILLPSCHIFTESSKEGRKTKTN